MKAKTLIAILLGGLILVNIGHNIIPHHHHLDNVLSHEDCQQHDANEHAGDADNPYNHCHAFNGLEYVLSFDQYSCLQPAHLILSICPVRISQADEPLSQEFSRHRAMGAAADCTGCLGKTSGLRAPPFIV